MIAVSSRRLAAALLLAGLCAAWPPAVSRAADLPPDLELVPRDAALFIHVRAADLWKCDALADVRRLYDQAGPAATKKFLGKFTPDLSSVERVTLVCPTPRTAGQPFPRVTPETISALLIVTTNKPYDRMKLRLALGLREKVHRHHLYYFNEDLWSGLVLVDDRTFLIGSEDAVIRFLDQSARRKGDGPLAPALAEAARKHHLTVGFNPNTFGAQEGANNLPPPLRKLLEARTGTFTIDLEKEAQVHLRLDYSDVDGAKTGEQALKDSVALVRDMMAMTLKQAEAFLKDRNQDREDAISNGLEVLLAVGLIRSIDGILEQMPIKRDGKTVLVPWTLKKGFESSGALGMAALMVGYLGSYSESTFSQVGGVITPEGKSAEEVHLEKLAAALEKYHKDKGSYPAPAIYDAAGRPLLSWRVALLPYLDNEPLYSEFKLDEPWDGPHNKRLLKKLPACYREPVSRDDFRFSDNQFRTSDMVFTGGGAAFGGKKGATREEVGNKTILLAIGGAGRSPYWTKPADLTYADDQPLASLFGKHGQSPLHVLLADGTFKTFKKGADEKELRSLIKRSAKPK